MRGTNMDGIGRRTYRGTLACLLAAACCLAAAGPAAAEVGEVKLARQYGIHYLPLIVMEQQKLVEKFAKQEGLPDLKVSWTTLSGGAAGNDALLAGAIDYSAVGVGPLIQIWDKSKGIVDIEGVAAVSDVPMTLVTRNPAIKTLKDFTDKDKIALPATKTSMQAVTLQIAAAKLWGESSYGKLDPLTVSMKHPDAMAAMLSGKGEITAHFTAAPYDYLELEQPGMTKVLTSYDVYGSSATLIVLCTSRKFRDRNPKVYKAVLSAMGAAMDLIKKDKRQAAEIYLEVTKEKTPIETMLKMLNDPLINFTTTPSATFPVAQFMHKVGRIEHQPASWKDLFFPEVHGQPGS